MKEFQNLPWMTLVKMAKHNARCFEQAQLDGDGHAEEICVRAYAAILAEFARRRLSNYTEAERD